MILLSIRRVSNLKAFLFLTHLSYDEKKSSEGLSMLRMLFIFCVAIGSFSACTMNRKIALQDSVDNYVKALSRGDENMALSFVAPEKRAQYFLNAEKMQSLQISQAEVKTIYPDEKLENALVTIFLEYFPASEMNVITEKRRLTWKYNEKAEAWYLDETKPFGRP